jgi:hypothetical protein
MVSEKHTDDPIDGIDVKTLLGWTHINDSDGLRKKADGERLGRSGQHRDQNPWVCLGND